MAKQRLHWYGSVCYLITDDNTYILNEEQSYIMNLLIEGFDSCDIINDICNSYEDLTVNEVQNVVDLILGELNENFGINRDNISLIPITGKYKMFFPYALTIHVTEDCPFNCKHCYKLEYEKGTINEQKIRELLSGLKNSSYKITFTGGEPLIYPGLMNVVRDFMNDFLFTLITSGYKTQPMNFDLFNEVQLSLYGFDDCSYEVFTGCQGGFSIVDKTITELLDSSTLLTISYIPKTTEIQELINVVEYCVKKGVSHLRVGELFNQGNAKYNYNFDDMFNEKVAYNVSEVISSYSNKIKIEYENEDAIDESNRQFFTCGAGVLHCIIMSNGDIVPCSLFAEPQFVLDDIYRQKVMKTFEEVDNLCILTKLFNQLNENDMTSLKMICKRAVMLENQNEK